MEIEKQKDEMNRNNYKEMIISIADRVKMKF